MKCDWSFPVDCDNTATYVVLWDDNDEDNNSVVVYCERHYETMKDYKTFLKKLKVKD